MVGLSVKGWHSHMAQVATPKPFQTTTRAYQSRQPWHSDPSIALEHQRDQAVDFDEFMGDAVEE